MIILVFLELFGPSFCYRRPPTPRRETVWVFTSRRGCCLPVWLCHYGFCYTGVLQTWWYYHMVSYGFAWRYHHIVSYGFTTSVIPAYSKSDIIISEIIALPTYHTSILQTWRLYSKLWLCHTYCTTVSPRWWYYCLVTISYIVILL